MKSKQTSDIYYQNKHHMDAFLGLDIYGEPGGGDPYYANTIEFCEDKERIDPNAEKTKNKLNKFKYLWRKIYDDSWLDDSHYFMILDNQTYYAWEQWYNSGLTLYYPKYKLIDCNGGPWNFNTTWDYISTKNGLMVSAREAGYWSGQTGPFDSWGHDDYISGKRYNFKDRALRLTVTPNCIDWYPAFIGRDAPDGIVGTYGGFYIASEGLYLSVQYGTNGNWASEECSFIYLPCRKVGRDVIIGKQKYFGRGFDKYCRVKYDESHYFSPTYTFTLKQYLFIVYSYESRFRIYRVDPNGNVTDTYSRYWNQIWIGKALAYNHNDKFYFMFSTKNTDSRDEAPVTRIATIDENGIFSIIYSLVHIYIIKGGYYYADDHSNKVEECFGHGYIQYDKKTDYFYSYYNCANTSYNFPVESATNYSRIIIGKTKDFTNFEFFTPVNPYILLKNTRNKKDTIAVYFDDRYAAQLAEEYFTFSIFNDVGYKFEGEGSRCCIHNEEICEPNGLFGKVKLYGYGERGCYKGMVFFIYNCDLTPSEMDGFDSIYDWEEDGTQFEKVGMKLINLLHGLDH